MIRAIAKPLDSVYSFRLSGFAICDATLAKLYTLHFLLPLLRLVVAVAHVALLHGTGSSVGLRDLRSETSLSFLEFGRYFGPKDLAGFMVFLALFAVLSLFRIRYVSHPDNMTPASPVGTPSHIAPEYYFLAAYSVLKSVPLKEVGFVVFGLVVVGGVGVRTSDALLGVVSLRTLVRCGLLLPSSSSLIQSGVLTVTL